MGTDTMRGDRNPGRHLFALGFGLAAMSGAAVGRADDPSTSPHPPVAPAPVPASRPPPFRDICRQTRGCAEEGECTAFAGSCIAYGYDCQRADVCLEEGRCFALDGACVANSASACARSQQCQEDGECDWNPEALVCDGGRRNNLPLMVTGITMLGVGAAAGISTVFFGLLGGFDEPLAIGFGSAAGGLLALGTAFTVTGAVKVPRDPASPEVSVGPGSLHLRWSF